MAVKNYIKVFEDGSQVATRYAPSFGSEYNSFGDYYDSKTKKWYSNVAVFSDDFSDGDISDWTPRLPYTTATFFNGAIRAENTTAGYGRVQTPTIQTVVGKRYRLKVSLLYSSTSSYNIYIGAYHTGIITGVQSKEIEIDYVAITTSVQISLGNGSSTLNGYNIWDNVSFIPLNDDGSIDISNATPYTSQPTYLPYTVDVDTQGNVLNVDKFDMPTLVEEYVKADIVEGEHKGKNSCTAWVNFDGTTTPPTIRDSYNVSQVIRTATGYFDVYFEEEMIDTNFSVISTSSEGTSEYNASATGYFLNKAQVLTRQPASTNVTNDSLICVQVFGGKN